MKRYITPALRVERVTTVSHILNLSIIEGKAADQSECFTEEEKPATTTNVWGEEW